MNTVATTAMTAQELHAAIVDGKVSVTEAKAVLRARIAKAEAEGRKPRAPSVQLLKELEDLKPRAKPTSLVNPVEALKAAKAAKQASAKAADANADALSNEQLLDLLRERAASDKSFLSSVGMLFVELTQAK
ncbi:hypothetical protein [Aeromonas sp. 602200]|uniref:hypothetical protein n=1 Tax=Aeromonas sp. 602200 TaxID=2712040 RepID=UPI003BA125A8